VTAISGGQPTLLTFTDNLSPVTPGNARFVFANAADAPPLQANLTLVGGKNKYKVTASSGRQQAITVPEGIYLVQVVVAGESTVLASEQVGLIGQSATFTYARERPQQCLGSDQQDRARRVLKAVFSKGRAWTAYFWSLMICGLFVQGFICAVRISG